MVEPAERHSLLDSAAEAIASAGDLLERAREAVARRVAPGGRIDPERLDREQHAAHGLAWLAVTVEALRQMRGWALRLDDAGRLGALEASLLELAVGEHVARIEGGIPMGQGEIARPRAMGVAEEALAAFAGTAVRRMQAAAADPVRRARLADLIQRHGLGDPGLSEPSLDLVREQFRRFADERVTPFAQGWHQRDELIPAALLDELAALGVFGLTVPEEWGGLGMGKEAMCVVTEELSRGQLGVGSLGTRSEIAAELVGLGGTAAQKARWLPEIAKGAAIPTAVFTEPDTGSDLGAVTTRAVLDGDHWIVTGAKTWITHAARADLMAILVRTDPARPGWRGLSMLLAEKPRGTDARPFPVAGLAGSEIKVLGYRGMKEYALAFDGFRVPAEGLLGGVPGQGFKQLMATFEAARIQTAARAVGVAVNAIELGLAYAQQRRQFGRSLAAFPRVADKLALMAAETMAARQLTLHAAREKDAGRRCDLEAGQAKLLAAQVAWAAADNALQIHGGNGYALEYPISRVLCDARILSVFEGAAEIQAQVVARRLLDG